MTKTLHLALLDSFVKTLPTSLPLFLTFLNQFSNCLQLLQYIDIKYLY